MIVPAAELEGWGEDRRLLPSARRRARLESRRGRRRLRADATHQWRDAVLHHRGGRPTPAARPSSRSCPATCRWGPAGSRPSASRSSRDAPSDGATAPPAPARWWSPAPSPAAGGRTGAPSAGTCGSGSRARSGWPASAWWATSAARRARRGARLLADRRGWRHRRAGSRAARPGGDPDFQRAAALVPGAPPRGHRADPPDPGLRHPRTSDELLGAATAPTCFTMAVVRATLRDRPGARTRRDLPSRFPTWCPSGRGDRDPHGRRRGGADVVGAWSSATASPWGRRSGHRGRPSNVGAGTMSTVLYGVLST